MDFETIIIGAGLSGLSAAHTLVDYGRSNFTVLEKSSHAGGRVHTIENGGFRLDLGFQVGLSHYPAFDSILPIKELEPCYFGSGALVEEKAGALSVLAHPFYHPGSISAAITSKLSLSDRIRLVALTASCLLRPEAEGVPPLGLTTTEYLRKRGFSEHILTVFFKPFFGGVFLDDDLETDASLFRYYLRHFTLGRAFLPRGGVSRMSDVLLGKIGRDKVRYQSEVTEFKAVPEGVEIYLAGSSTPLRSKKLILATDPDTTANWLGWPRPAFNATKVVYFSSTRSIYDGPWIVLPSAKDRLAQHFVQLTNIDSSLAPSGRELISATILDDKGLPGETLTWKVSNEIRRLFPDTAGDLVPLKVISVPRALPVQSPSARSAVSTREIPDVILLAGDLISNASLQNALQSGKEAALRAMSRL